MSRRSFLMSLASTAIPGVDPNAISRQATKITVSVTVELGAEKGQPLGTLFQLRRTNSYEIVAALGVPQFYNHFVRNNPRMLHAHGQTGVQSAFTVTELGSPRADNPRYHCFVLDGVLIDGTNRQYFDEGTNAWLSLPTPWHGATFVAGEQINYAHWIGNGLFISTDKGVFYDGVRIINLTGNPTYKSGLGAVLYYNGRLFTDYADGTLRAYSWTPGGAVGAPINSFPLIETHFLRAFSIHGGIVYAISGYGRVLKYDWDGNSWSYVTQAESVFEFYSAMETLGVPRFGDYPNGNQWVINGAGAMERLPNYPPVEAGAGPAAREVQAMTMYGGDMVLPTWPWGVVHRQHMATGDWYYQRLYTAPAISTINSPYYDVFGHNGWGQRIPCTGLMGDGTFMTASPYGGDLQAANYTSVPNLSEYGKVWKLTRPHAVSAELDWKAGQTTFSLEISAAGIVLKQDDVTLGAVDGFSPSQFEGSDPITLQVGDGIYGAFPGTIIGSNVSQEF